MLPGVLDRDESSTQHIVVALRSPTCSLHAFVFEYR